MLKAYATLPSVQLIFLPLTRYLPLYANCLMHYLCSVLLTLQLGNDVLWLQRKVHKPTFLPHCAHVLHSACADRTRCGTFCLHVHYPERAANNTKLQLIDNLVPKVTTAQQLSDSRDH
jgi:hypothetical protein